AGLGDRGPAFAALGVQGDAVGGDEGQFALGGEVDVLAGSEDGVGAADPEVVFGGDGGQAVLTVDDQMQLAPGDGGAVAAADAGAGTGAVAGGSQFGAELLLGGDGVEFVGGRFVVEAGLLLLRDVGQALREAALRVEYANAGGGIHLALAARAGEVQAGAAAQCALGLRRQGRTVAEVGV